MKFYVEHRDEGRAALLPIITDDVLELLADPEEDLTRSDLQLVCHPSDLEELAALLDLDELISGGSYTVDAHIYLNTISAWLFAEDIEFGLGEWDDDFDLDYLPDWDDIEAIPYD